MERDESLWFNSIEGDNMCTCEIVSAVSYRFHSHSHNQFCHNRNVYYVTRKLL